MSDWLAYLDDELRRELDDSGVDYAAVWERLVQRMDRADAEGPLALLARHEDLPEQSWEGIEQTLNQRIAQHREYDEPVEECVRAEREQAPEAVRRSEQRLEQALDAADQKPAWEQALAADEVVSLGRWERIEKGLFHRIASSDVGISYRRRIVVFPAVSVLKAAAVLALAVAGGAAGLRVWKNSFAAVPTYVVQANGAGMAMAAEAARRSDRYDVAPGGGLELANRHGFVRLQNGASLVVERASRAAVTYRLRMPRVFAPGDAAGKATFFVERAAGRKAFTVATAEYDIRVHGTYFRVTAGIGNRLTTEVLEGAVLVNVQPLGTIEIRAGQRLAFDDELGRYALFGGGPVVERSDIPAMPDLAGIASFRPLTITANVALADVTVDGVYRGTAPMWLLAPPGPHRVRVQSEGMAELDTTVLVEGETALYAALVPGAPQAAAGHRTPPAVTTRRPAPGAPQTAFPPVAVAGDEQPSSEEALVAAQALERTDPQSALAAYQALLRRDDLPAVVRQSALFATGRLQAEHGRDQAGARESFMRYLALYPAGTFAREALLRLAELEFVHDQEQSIAYYLRFCELYPTHYRVPELRYRVGLIYQQRKRLDDAVYMFRQALSDMPGDEPQLRERVRIALYRALLDKGDTAGARLVEK